MYKSQSVFVFQLAAVVSLCASTLLRADSNETFDSPWIGYDTAVYPEGLWPYASVTADFDGDLVPDLAVSAWDGTPWMSVMFGDGNGGFRPPQLYPLTVVAQDLVAEDFDQDGDIDLAIAEGGRFWEGLFVSLWRNDGEGGFVLGGQFFTGDDGPSGITSADFNGDGWIDVAVAHDEYITSDNSFSIMLNNQNGGFHSGVVYHISSGTNDIHSGDIDNDGDPDIAVAHENNFWTLMENIEGQFQSAGTFTGIDAGSIPADPTVHIADVDLDGFNDVMFSNRGTGGFGQGAIGLWRNDGAGGFPVVEEISLLTPEDNDTGGGIDIHIADVTHDGWPDLIVCNDNWYLIAGDGGGGFEPPRLFHAGDGSIDSNTTDFDLDGDLDVIILGYGSMEACVYLNPGQGQFEQPDPLPMADPVYAPAFANRIRVDDIDDDGDLDLVSGYRSDFSERHALTVRKNNGDGTFGPIIEYLHNTYALDLQLADMDGDGHEDLLFVLNGGRFYVRVNDGAGNFGSALGYHIFGAVISQLEAEDIDADGDLDVIVDGLFVSRNNGSLNFSPPFQTGCSQFFEFFDLGDFDNDGVLDLLTDAGAQGYPTFSFGSGDGTFGTCFTIPTGRDVHAFDVADLDNDGNLDFVSYYNLDEMGLGVRRGRGDGNFFEGTNYPGAYFFGDHTSTVDLADFNEDGFLDAVTASFGGQDFSFWQGLGDGTFLQDVRYGVGWNAFDVEPGDFDGDGNLDLAVICQVDNGRWWYPGVVIIKGRGAGSFDSVVNADQLNIFRGIYVTGDLSDSFESDDSYLKCKAGLTLNPTEPPVWIEFEGTLPTDSPTSLSVTLEASVNTPNLNQTIEAFNWLTGQYEQVDSQLASFNNDSVVAVDLTADIGKYVESGTGAVKTRTGWRQTGGLILLFPWTVCIDQVVWSVTE